MKMLMEYDFTILVVIVLYIILASFLIGLGYNCQDNHQYRAYFFYGLAIVSIFIFIPLTIWILYKIGWITFGPMTNLTGIRNITT